MKVKIYHIYDIPKDVVQYYWQTLAMHDTLKYRLSDIDDPSWSDVLKMIRTFGQHMYMVIDENEFRVVGEFMLENFTGKSAQVHFSMHPENTLSESLIICRHGLTQVLSRWKDKKDDTQPLFDSLFGLTPMDNRRACLFILKAGFRKLGIVRSACQYRGHICDGLITTVIREDLEYG